MITIREYKKQDATQAMEIWNEVVREGVAFPQLDELTEQEADGFFSSQSYTGVAEDSETGVVVGLYILHPNNVGQARVAHRRVAREGLAGHGRTAGLPSHAI